MNEADLEELVAHIERTGVSGKAADDAITAAIERNAARRHNAAIADLAKRKLSRLEISCQWMNWEHVRVRVYSLISPSLVKWSK